MTADLLQNAINTDPWKNRVSCMRCKTCMWFVQKVWFVQKGEKQPVSWVDAEKDGIKAERKIKVVGRCRRHAPTMSGYPVCYEDDWCGDHRVDENKI